MTDTAQLYGDGVAMGYGTSPSFYRYQDRNLGINLGNTEAPVYEWALIGAPGTEGQAIAAGTPVPIWNTHGTFLIHFDRTAGVDLGGPDSKTWGEQIGQVAWEKAKVALETYVKSYIGG